MYSKITQIKDLYAAYEIYADKLICNISNELQSHNITFYDDKFHLDYKLIQTSYDFFIHNNLLFFTTDVIIEKERKVLKSYLLNLNNKQIKELPYTLHIEGIKNKDKYICWGNKGYAEETKESFYFIINLNTFNIEKELSKSMGLSQLRLFLDNGLIFTDAIKGLIGYFNFENIQLWQQDLSEITAYKDWSGEYKGDVKRVYACKDKIILTSGDSVLALALDTGKILWQVRYSSLDFTPLTLHIVNDVAYLSKGAYYSSIDLDKGVKLFEMMLQRPFDLDSKYWTANLASVGSDMTYSEGYFYFTDKTEKYYYLAKMKPETGIIEDYQILDGITSNLAPPKFHDNKMFLLDSRNTLHIYEKEK